MWSEQMVVFGEDLKRLRNFTGIVVSSDYYALALMDMLRHRGVKIRGRTVNHWV